MLQFDRVCALYPDGKDAGGFRVVAAGPYETQRLGSASKLRPNDVFPVRNDVDGGEPLPRERRLQRSVDKVGKRLGSASYGLVQGVALCQSECMTLAGPKRAVRRNPAIPSPSPATLLAWYDRNRRDLPWRARPGETPDPYRVWLSEIMLQQTRVETVVRYYGRFLRRFPTIEELAAARQDTVLKLWAGLGYYARARNLHACARTVVARHGGRFPSTEEELRALPGIGAYTAAAIAAIAFGSKAAPVDGNIERVVARLFAVATSLPAGKPELRSLAAALVPDKRAGDFAQAMMDLGATICAPKRPSCGVCPWRHDCAALLEGRPERFPLRAPKREGQLRRGAAYVVRRTDGAVLVRRRPPNGLLGGMVEVPTTEWRPDFEPARSDADKVVALGSGGVVWRALPGVVRHVFTHFPLELSVFSADVGKRTRAPKGMRFVAAAALDAEALPSLMRKVIAHAARRTES
jgi:A/G-specific adenine glycosylase